MAFTYEDIERFMLDYFPAYSEKAQSAETQHELNRFYAPDISFDNGMNGRDIWYRACASHPTLLDTIEVERLCIDVRRLMVSAKVKARLVENPSGAILNEIGMNALYTLAADDEGELKIVHIDVYLESNPAKAARMMELLRTHTVM